MTDPILSSFLRHNLTQAQSLAANSDLLTFTPEPSAEPRRFIAEYRCKGLVQAPGGVQEADRFLVGIAIPDNYLRGPVDPARVLTWLGPANVFHPNIRAPFICVGRLDPGMDFLFLLYQIFEMIVWRKHQPADALNPAAAQWARNHLDRLPIDARALTRTPLNLDIQTLKGGAS